MEEKSHAEAQRRRDREKVLRHHLGLSLATGYILFYFGEIVFWATPEREGMSAGSQLITWLVYSVFAYVFLIVVSSFQARNLWAVFLAGAVYGWFEEGVVLQTTYGSPDTPFPMSISFTALAWHALLDVLVGWYLVRKVLAAQRLLAIVCVAALVGAFYGYWAIFWWTEPPAEMASLLQAGAKREMLCRFGGYAFVTSGLLIVAYGFFHRLAAIPFKSSQGERWAVGLVTLVYFVLVTVRAAPKSLWVLPPLLGLTFMALARNRRLERRPDAIVAFQGAVESRRYLVLLLIPSVATTIYFLGLALDVRMRSNLVVYYCSSVVGTGLWLASLYSLLRPGQDVK